MTIAPWRVETKGDCTVRLAPVATGQALEWRLGASQADGSMGTLTHPGLTNLLCATSQAYRIAFVLEGAPGNRVNRHPQVAAPLVVRTIYAEQKPGAKREYRYDWMSFYPAEKQRVQHFLIVSPAADRWQLASVTFFLWQAGTYRLDEVTLESWQ